MLTVFVMWCELITLCSLCEVCADACLSQHVCLSTQVCLCLTQLVEVCVYAMRSWYRADQPSFDEGAPLVDQHSLASNVILAEKTEIHTVIKHSCTFTSKCFIVLAQIWIETVTEVEVLKFYNVFKSI